MHRVRSIGTARQVGQASDDLVDTGSMIAPLPCNFGSKTSRLPRVREKPYGQRAQKAPEENAQA